MTSPWSNQRVALVIIDASITGFSGLFVYSPVEGAGNLVASIAAAAGTDPFTNAYQPGITTYGSGSFIQLGVIAGLPVLVLHASGGTGDGTIQPLAAGAGYELVLTSPNAVADTNASLLLISELGSGLGVPAVVVPAGNTFEVIAAAIVGGGLAVTGGETADTVAVSSGQAGGLVLAVANTTAAPTAPNVRITSAAGGDAALGIRIAGDTANRLLLDDNGVTGGRIRAGSGAAALDAALFRTAANQWAADYIAFNNAGAAESWQSVGGTGAAFAGTWVNAAAPGVPLQYRRNAAPYKSVQWVGRVTNTVAQAAGSAITAAVAAPYRPANTHDMTCFNITTGAVVRVSIGATGVLICQSAIAANDVVGIADISLGLDA